MSSTYHEFTEVYREFQKRFPNHELNDELRSRIRRGQFPTDEWLRSRIRSMKDIMAPLWVRAGSRRGPDSEVLPQ
jgi:hypothetical protein